MKRLLNSIKVRLINWICSVYDAYDAENFQPVDPEELEQWADGIPF